MFFAYLIDLELQVPDHVLRRVLAVGLFMRSVHGLLTEQVNLVNKGITVAVDVFVDLSFDGQIKFFGCFPHHLVPCVLNNLNYLLLNNLLLLCCFFFRHRYLYRSVVASAAAMHVYILHAFKHSSCLAGSLLEHPTLLESE